MSKIILNALLVLFFAGLLVDAAHSQEPTSTSDPKTLAEFKIAKGGDPMLLPVRFKGKEYLFVLDTGLSHMVFDSSFKNVLGKAKKTEKGFTAGGPMDFELFDAPKAFLGPFNLKDCGGVFCIDLNMLSLIAGRKVSGVIGMNFLKNYVVQMDFDKGKLLFLKPATTKNPDWGQAFEIEYYPIGIPFISGIILNDIKVDFMIDTGNNGTVILRYFIFEKIVSGNQIKTSNTLAETAAGTVRCRSARMGNLSIGSFEYQGLIFDEGNFNALGLSFFSRHLVTFDFPNNRIYLKKGKKFEEVDEVDMSGLHLLRISNKTVVYSVDQGSPAQRAGIRANDVILKVNDEDAKAYDIWELRRLLKSGDRYKIKMTIKTDDDVKEVSFLLKKQI